MRVPLSWLREYVDITVSAEELADRLTFSGIEVSEIQSIGVYNPNVFSATILTKQELQNRAGVFEVKLQVGNRVIDTISNAQELHTLAEGTSIAVALDGAILFDKDYNLKEVKSEVRYNRECSAALCSLFELGIRREEKLCVLPQETPSGNPVRSLLEADEAWFADEVLVVEILANIARCQCISGVAQEVAAILRQPFRKRANEGRVKLSYDRPLIENKIPDLVTYFSLVGINSVEIKESPDHIKRMLALSGVKSINNIIDIGNYVMLETGQPVHVYDADRLSKQELTLRLSEGEESFVPLSSGQDKNTMMVPPGIITIRSGEETVAIAGLIGSDSSAVRDSTRNILLEVANFDLIAIRKAQGKLKLYTEASARFSRGVSPNKAELATQRFIELLSASSPSISIECSASSGDYESLLERSIPFSPRKLNEALGTSFSGQEVKELLERVGIRLAPAEGGSVLATIPLSREDLLIENDLYEEVARLLGYDRMPITMPESEIPYHPVNHQRKMREVARDAMVLAGLNEIITYSMSVPEDALFFGKGEGERYVTLRNPVSADKTVLRRSLAPGMLHAIAHNLKYCGSCSLFEIGNVFLPREGEPLPAEPFYLTIGVAGVEHEEYYHNKKPRRLDIFDLKGKVEFLFDHLGVSEVKVENFDEGSRLYQPGICGVIRRGEKVYGYLGKVHPIVASRYEIESPVYCAEIYLEEVINDCGGILGFEEPEKFPSISIDVSLLVDKGISAGDIVFSVESLKHPQIRHLEVFDLYSGTGIDRDKKSISVRLTLSDRTRTLEQGEANALRDEVLAFLHARCGATLR